MNLGEESRHERPGQITGGVYQGQGVDIGIFQSLFLARLSWGLLQLGTSENNQQIPLPLETTRGGNTETFPYVS